MAEQPVQRLYWSEKAIDWPGPLPFLLVREGKTCIMLMRNATCAGAGNIEGSDSSGPSVYFLFCALVFLHHTKVHRFAC